MKKILIIGKNSYIGNSFERYLLGDKNFQIEKISVRNDDWKNLSFSSFDVIFYVAGIAHSDYGKISEEKSKIYFDVNTKLMINIAKKAKIDGVKQFIFISSAIIYGDSSPIGENKIIDFDSIPMPINAYGKSKLLAEFGLIGISDYDEKKLSENDNVFINYSQSFVFDINTKFDYWKDKVGDLSKFLTANNLCSVLNKFSKFKISIIRPPMVYGDNCKGNYRTLVKLAKKLPIFPYIKNQKSVIHIDKLCEFIKNVIINEKAGVYLPQDDEYMNTSEMVLKIAKDNRKKIILVKGLDGILKLLSKWTPLVNKAFGNFVYKL